MKKLISLALILTLICSLLLCGCTKNTEDYVINDSDTIRIGVLLPTSGDFADIGQRAMEGVEYASSLASSVQLDKEYKIELVVENADGDMDDIARQFISQNVAAVICAGGNEDNTDAIISAFESESTPLVFVDCYSETIASAENAFSISLPYNFQSSTVYSYLTNQLYHSGAVVCAADESYSKSYAEYFNNTFTEYSGQTLSTYYYSGDFSNFNAATIAGAQLDFVYIVGNLRDSKKVYSELMSAGVTAQIVFSEVFDKTQLEKSEYNSVAFVSNFEPDDNNYIGSDFLNNYSESKSVSKDSISAITAYGYDAYMLIYDVLRSFNPSSQSLGVFNIEATTEASENSDIAVSEVAEAIKTIQHYGVTDNISFDDKGLSVPSFMYIDKIEKSNAIMLNRYDYDHEEN